MPDESVGLILKRVGEEIDQMLNTYRAKISVLLTALEVYADESNFAEGNDWYWIGDDDPKSTARAAIALINDSTDDPKEAGQ
ncbi:MAG TPA: hypothetical protein VNL17_14590 [Verrucomicrobiae bacterium]|nr:hypothetical protein [Verrucomicrobiae bacterium]